MVAATAAIETIKLAANGRDFELTLRNNPYHATDSDGNPVMNGAERIFTIFELGFQTTKFTYYMARLVEKVGKLFIKCMEYLKVAPSSSPMEGAQKVTGVFGPFANTMSVFALPGALGAAFRALGTLFRKDVVREHKNERTTTEKALDAFNKVCDAVAYTCYATLTFVSNKTLALVGDAASVFADGSGAVQKGMALREAIHIRAEARATKASQEIKDKLDSEISIRWVELSKEVAAVAAAILVITAAFSPFIAFIALTVSVASTALAVAAYVARKDMHPGLEIKLAST